MVHSLRTARTGWLDNVLVGLPRSDLPGSSLTAGARRQDRGSAKAVAPMGARRDLRQAEKWVRTADASWYRGGTSRLGRGSKTRRAAHRGARGVLQRKGSCVRKLDVILPAGGSILGRRIDLDFCSAFEKAVAGNRYVRGPKTGTSGRGPPVLTTRPV